MKNHPTDALKLMILDYQTVYLQNINKRQNVAVSSHNAYHVSMMKDIWNAAKVDGIVAPGLKKWKKIGFSVNRACYSFFLMSNVNTFSLQTEVPQREFGRTGVFGLEEMHYFAMNEEDLYSKVKTIT